MVVERTAELVCIGGKFNGIQMIRNGLALLEELEVDDDVAERRERLRNEMSASSVSYCYKMSFKQ
jgi:hypothetical protein